MLVEEPGCARSHEVSPLTDESVNRSSFESHVFPCDRVFACIEELPAFAPFNTMTYARARSALGEVPHVFLLREANRIIAACVGFLASGRFTRRLEIPSFPKLDDPSQFVWGLNRFCREHDVWDLILNTYGSEAPSIPAVGTEIVRRQRQEFVLDVQSELPLGALHSNHRRNVERASKAGLRVVTSRANSAARYHVEAMNSSMSRRQKRGEDVAMSVDDRVIVALLESGSGQLYQAVKDGMVMSSILLVESRRTAYYHSAGTSAEGMRMGASPFLITRIAAQLRERGFVEFNLGGAEPENAGLYRFKSGFGARVRSLEAASFVCVGPVRRKLRSLVRALKANPASVVSVAMGLERYVVYAADPRTIHCCIPPSGVRIGPISDAELAKLSNHPDFGYSARKLATLGRNSAFGVWVGEALAHLAWIIDPMQDVRQAVRNVKLRAGEREITHCVTARGFRGRGLYPTAIAHLCAQAAQQGAKKVIMITGRDNASSRRGIEKAGLRRCGTVVRLFLRRWPAHSLTWRGHRF